MIREESDRGHPTEAAQMLLSVGVAVALFRLASSRRAKLAAGNSEEEPDESKFPGA
jgi:hypothetical protein